MKKTSSSAWLDGCRGYAALIVVIFHFLMPLVPSLRFGYGMELPVGYLVPGHIHIPEGAVFVPGDFSRPDSWKITDPSRMNNYHWYQVPFIRLLFAGDSMVNVFFVVSGYALSIKSLKLMRSGAKAELCSSLGSSLWRRPIRLFGPTLASTLLIAIMAGLGMFNTTYRTLGFDTLGSPNPVDVNAESRKYFKGTQWEPPPPWKLNIFSHLLDWAVNMYNYYSPLLRRHTRFTDYDLHLWTIPIEYQASLVLYMTHAVFALVQARYCNTLLVILLFFATALGDVWEQSLFWAGMLLCNLDLDRAKKTSQDAPTSRLMTKSWYLVLCASLFLMSYPELEPHMVPWTAWVSKICFWNPWYPRNRLIQGIGACGFVYVVPRLTFLESFFSNSLARYLGRISYSLYLVHGPIFRSLGHTVFLKILKDPHFSPSQYHTACAISVAVSLLVAFGVAHLFSLWVDEPFVQFARWTEKFVFVQASSKGVQQKEEDSNVPMEAMSLLPLHHEPTKHESAGTPYTDEPGSAAERRRSECCDGGHVAALLAP